MFGKFKIAQYCIRMHLLKSLTSLGCSWHLWLLCAKLLSSLHTTILSPKSFLSFCVKHWQNKMFNNLCGKFWGDISYRNCISSMIYTLSNWLSCTFWGSRWDYWKFHDIIIFAHRLLGIHVLTLLPWTAAWCCHNEVIKLDLVLVIHVLCHSRKWSAIIRSFRRNRLQRLLEASLILWSWNDSSALQWFIFRGW